MSESLAAPQLTIDLAAVAANWTRLGAHAPSAEVAAMVKADAYGLGAPEVAPALAAAGCVEFFVADAGEGIELRAVLPDAEIFVLAGAHVGTVDDLRAHRLVPVLISAPQVERWTALAAEQSVAVAASIHFDTGMNRTGLDRQETEWLSTEPGRTAGLDIVHMMSHLASADDPESEQNARQLDAFTSLRRAHPRGRASLVNTPGIALGAAFHFDHVRPGVGLYGADPSPGRVLGLQPVVELHAPVVQVRESDDGTTVGYGATHTNHGVRRLATIAAGYGDGIMRAQSSRGHVAFAGHRAPIVGRVSMDLLTVDITDLPPSIVVQPGTAAELIGSTITIDDVAEAADTIAYEILTSLGNRYRRTYHR